MTTKYEPELKDIEYRMAAARRGAKVKVHDAEKLHLETQRARERERDRMTGLLGKEIRLRWSEGEPSKWNSASCEAEIGEKSYILDIEPYEEHDGKMRLKPKLVKLGYKKFAEDWALWKWHTARGSELDEVNDAYILDCDPPAFVWAEARKKPGPKPKVAEAA